MIDIDGLSKQYRKTQALREVSFSLGRGVTGLLGQNGAGKTTLLRCVLGIIRPTSGTVRFADEGSTNGTAIGYLPQRFGLLKELTVREALTYFAALKRIPRAEIGPSIDACLRQVNLSESASTRIGALSGGMLRRVGIASALLGDPATLLFDEPTAGLDPEERVRFKRLVSTLADSHAVLVSTHIVEDIEALASRVIILHEGRIAATGTLEQIADLARDKCFLAPRDRVNEHSTEYHVDRYVEIDGQELARVISPRRYEHFAPTEPTVEDGYLCVTRGLT